MRTLLIVISIVCAWATIGSARAEVPGSTGIELASAEQVSQTWQILDYLADDYRGAVVDGRILSASDDAEMRECVQTVTPQLHALPKVAASSALQEAAERLARSIANKDAADGVA